LWKNPIVWYFGSAFILSGFRNGTVHQTYEQSFKKFDEMRQAEKKKYMGAKATV
jgi:hypothetical protein